MRVTTLYQEALTKKGYSSDAAQEAAIVRLQRCQDDWEQFEVNKGILSLFSKPKPPPKGVYFWGGVGRGKSFIMDSFYDAIEIKAKTRLHFHEFMREVHRELQDLRGQADPLDILGKMIGKRYKLICFDEFHVSDVADAMILYRLLDALFKNGVQFIMTSNYRPDLLYPDGLHRDRILPAIALLENKLDVLNIDAGIDYRKIFMDQVKAYHCPLGPEVIIKLNDIFDHLAGAHEEKDADLRIENRTIKAYKRAGSIVWFDFDTLCAGPRSQNDYLEIANMFHTVILSDVPKMYPRMSSEARRFTWLIDVFYDHKIKLVISAEVPCDELYVEGQMSNEFHRTVSRIIEMQSREYLDTPRRLIDTSLT
ncbi:MAG: cell division protein ZapE [Betaproteobacteria bacterium]